MLWQHIVLCKSTLLGMRLAYGVRRVLRSESISLLNTRRTPFLTTRYYVPLIINQKLHYIKFHIKKLKIAPTCFDPKIILRELRCSLPKPF